MTSALPKRGRARRIVLWALLVLSLLAALVVAALRLLPVDRALLGKVAAAVREKTGGELSAEGVSTQPLTGRVELTGVSWGEPGASPFARARRLVVEVEPSSLAGRPRVRALEVEGLVLDLDARLPKPATSDDRPLSLLLPADVDRLEVRNLEVVGKLPEGLASRLGEGGLRVSRARLTGSSEAGRTHLVLTMPDVRVGSLRFSGSVSARNEGASRAVLAGRLAGEGLELHEKGSVDLDGPGELRLTVDLAGELARLAGRLAPEARVSGSILASAEVTGTFDRPAATARVSLQSLTSRYGGASRLQAAGWADRERVEVSSLAAQLEPGGTLKASGHHEIGSGTTELSLEAQALPASLLDQWLPSRERARLAGTLLDASASGGLEPLEGTLTATLREEGRTLASARLVAGRTATSPGEARLKLDASLLPEAPGTRTLAATLAAPSISRLGEGRLVGGDLKVETADLEALLASLSRRVPELAKVPPAWRRGALTARARLSGSPRTPIVDLSAALDGGDGSRVELTAKGRADASGPVDLAARVTALPVSRLEMPDLAGGSVEASLSFHGQLPAGGERLRPFEAKAELAATDLVLSGQRVDALKLSAHGNEREVIVGSLSVEAGERRLLASGRLDPGRPLAAAALEVRLERPASHVAWAALPLTLERGVLRLASGTVETDVGTLLVGFDLPLGSLARVPRLAGKLGFLPAGLPDGTLSLTVLSPLLDSAAWQSPGAPAPAAATPGEPRLHVCTGLEAALDVDLARPIDAAGTLRLPGLFVDSGLAFLRAASPVELTLEGGVLTLAPLTLTGEAGALAVGGDAVLASAASGGGLTVTGFTAATAGDVSASLLRPFLAGGVATGRLHVAGEAAGTLADVAGRLQVFGAPGATTTETAASFFWPSPFATKISAPELSLTFGGGGARLESGSLALNGGKVSLSGEYEPKGGLSLSAELADVRYVLSYGLRASFGGWLALTLPPEGKGERALLGALSMDHGILDRDVDLDREILSRLLSPPESEGSEASVLSTIGLDLTVETATGVRVRNNLADLKARWSTLSFGGTLHEPLMRGRIDVDRGGLVFAYQQTFRIERCALTYVGDPSVDPRIDAVTTSSLQDASVARKDPGPPSFHSAKTKDVEYGETESAAASAVAYGLAGYYGERVTSRLGQALGVTIRPILIFSEADPGARLTVSRELGRNVSFAFSLDLTNAQQQTYLLDLHGFRGLPTMTMQAFTKDDGLWGGTVQQSFDLPKPAARESEPELRELRVSTGVPGLDKRLRKGLGLRKGDAVGKARLFDLEVDAERLLREAGRPDAVATAVSVPVPGTRPRVDVTVTARPGAPARVVFEGDALPSPSRGAIASLYRGDPFQEEALEEMRKKTVRVLRSLAHLRPEVDASVETLASGERVVHVRVRAGSVTPVEEVRLSGLPSDEAALPLARFRAPLERAELALGEPSADGRLRAALSALGYARARVAGRSLENGVLTVDLEPGPRTVAGRVAVEGFEDPGRLLALVPLKPGEPLRSDRLAEGTLRVTQELLKAGHADARVRAVLSGAEGDPVRDVSLRVEPGTAYRLAAVDFGGLRGTSRRFLTGLVALPPGEPLVADRVDAARGRLVETGLFSSVRAETRKDPDGTAHVLFDVTPLPRFTVSYGVRFENTLGFGGVVDLVDHSFLGRGITLGLRGSYDRQEQGGRLFVGAKDVLGTRFSVDAFAQGSREETEDSNLRVDSWDGTLQVSRPLSRFLSARVYGRWHRETISEITPDPFFPLDPITITSPYLGLQAVYDSREDALTSDRGVFASVDLSGSGDYLGSDFAYVRLFGQVNLYQPLGSVLGIPVSWAQSVRVGLAKAFHEQELVRSARFFAGGEYSIRGYGRNNVGPREDLGGDVFPAGGPALLVVNEELRVPVLSRLMGVAFFDTGNVWETTRGFGSGLKSSFGLGLRVLTPVGILRVDGARPLSPRDGDPSFKVYLGFGSTF